MKAGSKDNIIFPCRIETENWYWNLKLQQKIYEKNIKWGYKIPAGWNSRTRKYLAILEKHNGGYYIVWMTKLDFETRGRHLKKVTAKHLLKELEQF